MIPLLLFFLALAIVAILFFRDRALLSKMPYLLEKTALSDSSQDRATAVVLHSKSGPYTIEKEWPRPRISPKEVLIRVHAIGLNPIDWKCVAYGFGIHSVPWISGREASGTIEEIGSEVQDFRKGDRLFVTSTNYRDNRTSTFQQFVVASPFNVGRLPDWLSFEDGATLGVGSVAAAAALFDGLEVSRAAYQNQRSSIGENGGNAAPWILIWGGSCVTGMMAIQLARSCGLRVFAVANVQNTSYLKDLGAEVVADRYKPEQVIEMAQALRISLAIDCVGQQTATFAAKALQPGGKLAFLVKRPEQSVADAQGIEATDILIKRFHEEPDYGQSLVDYISRGLFSRALRPVRHEVVPGGLDGLQNGLERLKSQTISGKKVVIVVQ